MPKRIAPLTDTKVRTVKPTEKPQKLGSFVKWVGKQVFPDYGTPILTDLER